MNQYDIIIIGGGCSGLSLAYHLIKNQGSKRICLLESRAQYLNDKTWCFWEKDESIWTKLSSTSWKQWSFHAEKSTKKITHSGVEWQYYHLAASSYYRYMTQYIANSPLTDLYMDSPALNITRLQHHSIESTSKSYRITTPHTSYAAKMVIDTRPQARLQSILFQSFYGVELTIPLSQQTRVISLMNNMRTDHSGFRFNYILPLRPDRILFEHTRFSKTPVSQEQLMRECQAEIDRLNIDSTRVIRSEFGVLPMGLKKIKKSEVIQGGATQGALRDATGYGFLRIHQWADQLSKQIISGHDVKSINTIYPVLNIQRSLDFIFLNTLSAEPQISPDVFMSMARGLDGETFARFMSDAASFIDLMKVITSMPTRPFLKSLLHSQEKVPDPL